MPLPPDPDELDDDDDDDGQADDGAAEDAATTAANDAALLAWLRSPEPGGAFTAAQQLRSLQALMAPEDSAHALRDPQALDAFLQRSR